MPAAPLLPGTALATENPGRHRKGRKERPEAEQSEVMETRPTTAAQVPPTTPAATMTEEAGASSGEPTRAKEGDVLTEADIMEVVLEHRAALTECVAGQQEREPDSNGKLVMRWTVHPDGTTSNVTVASEEHQGTYIASCVGKQIKEWVFPHHELQREPVTFPFKF